MDVAETTVPSTAVPYPSEPAMMDMLRFLGAGHFLGGGDGWHFVSGLYRICTHNTHTPLPPNTSNLFLGFSTSALLCK